MSYELTEADFADEAQPHRDHLPTRQLTPLEIEELVEPERRYTPEPGELEDEAAVPPVAASHGQADASLLLPQQSATPVRASHPEDASRHRHRTERMRVYNFKPLLRPTGDDDVAGWKSRRAS